MEKRYKDLIDSMYSASSEVKVEAPVTYRDGRRGVVTTTIKVRDVD
jgi:long-chain acyl-CoA synthetase